MLGLECQCYGDVTVQSSVTVTKCAEPGTSTQEKRSHLSRSNSDGDGFTQKKKKQTDADGVECG